MKVNLVMTNKINQATKYDGGIGGNKQDKPSMTVNLVDDKQDKPSDQV